MDDVKVSAKLPSRVELVMAAGYSRMVRDGLVPAPPEDIDGDGERARSARVLRDAKELLGMVPEDDVETDSGLRKAMLLRTTFGMARLSGANPEALLYAFLRAGWTIDSLGKEGVSGVRVYPPEEVLKPVSPTVAGLNRCGSITVQMVNRVDSKPGIQSWEVAQWP